MGHRQEPACRLDTRTDGAGHEQGDQDRKQPGNEGDLDHVRQMRTTKDMHHDHPLGLDRGLDPWQKDDARGAGQAVAHSRDPPTTTNGHPMFTSIHGSLRLEGHDAQVV